MRIRFTLLAIITLLLFVMNIIFGAINIPIADVTSAIFGQGGTNEAISFIVNESRIPQAITAGLAGGGLAVTGLMLQTIFRNPLAGPSILGITSGANLGVALIILLFGGILSIGNISIAGNIAIIAGAIAGSFMIMSVLILLSSRLKSNLMVLIAGIMTGYLTSSIVTLLSSISSSQGIQGYVVWGMGTFSTVTWTQMPWLLTICMAGFIASILLAKPLNILLLGDRYAANLGVNVKNVRTLIFIVSGTLTAVVTAFCGPIGFIGLAVPHIARIIFRTDNHHTLLPASILIGAATALLCNLASTLPANTIIPINALTPIVGVPVVLYVLIKPSSSQ